MILLAFLGSYVFSKVFMSEISEIRDVPACLCQIDVHMVPGDMVDHAMKIKVTLISPQLPQSSP
jgi:hypothetical protein